MQALKAGAAGALRCSPLCPAPASPTAIGLFFQTINKREKKYVIGVASVCIMGGGGLWGFHLGHFCVAILEYREPQLALINWKRLQTRLSVLRAVFQPC